MQVVSIQQVNQPQMKEQQSYPMMSTDQQYIQSQHQADTELQNCGFSFIVNIVVSAFSMETLKQGENEDIIISPYRLQIICLAALSTLVVTVSLTIYAYFTKTDYTIKGGLFFMTLVLLLVACGFTWITNIKIGYIALTVSLTFLYGLYLVFDTQLIVSEDSGFNLEEDDYILGAMLLYIDIIMIFLRILRILVEVM